MNSKSPTLFRYTTKELDQDAALTYILTWVRPEYCESHPRRHGLGADLLRALLTTEI